MTDTNQTAELELPVTALSSSPLIPCEAFSELDLEPAILKSLEDIGWKEPTKVQALCLPLTLAGRHVAGFAQTGTGKTGVFLLTIMNMILKSRSETGQDKSARGSAPKAIVLVPTRELAMQIASDAQDLFGSLPVKFMAVFGGTGYESQANSLKEGIDVIIATPGRLKDFYQKKLVTLDQCVTMVCDEADRMLDMGFIDDAEYFLSRLNEDVQKLLFSATTNEQVKELAFEYLENPEYISVNPESMTPENIDQRAVICESSDKVRVLLGLLRDEKPGRTIIFTNTKLVADWLHYKLEKNGYNADVITGDLPQNKRIALIQRIKKGDIGLLIATDVASRGLHISDVTHVFNFDLPDEAANYIHRIGRTARAGAKGRSISLVCEDYGHNLEAIKELMGEQIELKSEWYKEEYLKIEDKSGNPYDDPSFRGSQEYQSPRSDHDSPAREGQGESDRPHQGSRRPSPSRRPTKSTSRNRPRPTESREASPERPSHKEAESSRSRSGSSSRKRRPNPQPKAQSTGQNSSQNQRRTPPPKAAAASAQSQQPERQEPKSVGAMLKSMVKSVFGFGKKSK